MLPHMFICCLIHVHVLMAQKNERKDRRNFNIFRRISISFQPLRLSLLFRFSLLYVVDIRTLMNLNILFVRGIECGSIPTFVGIES